MKCQIVHRMWVNELTCVGASEFVLSKVFLEMCCSINSKMQLLTYQVMLFIGQGDAEIDHMWNFIPSILDTRHCVWRCLAWYQPIKPFHVDNTIMLKFNSISESFFLSFLPSKPTSNPYLHYCWMKGCNVAGTCPISCIFLFLCSLVLFVVEMSFLSQIFYTPKDGP